MSDASDDIGQMMLNYLSRAAWPAGRYLVRKLRERANAGRESSSAAASGHSDMGQTLRDRNASEGEGTRWAAIECDCAEMTPVSVRESLEGGLDTSPQSVSRLRAAITGMPTEYMMREGVRSLADLASEERLHADESEGRDEWLGRACERFRAQGAPVTSKDMAAALEAMEVYHEVDGRAVIFREADVERVERAWSMLAGPDEPAFTLNGDEERRLVSVVLDTHEQAQALERALAKVGIDASRDGREVVASVRSGGRAHEAEDRVRIERMAAEISGRDGHADVPGVKLLESQPITDRQATLIGELASERGLEVDAEALATLSRADANFVITTVLEADGHADLGGRELSPERQLEVYRKINVPVPEGLLAEASAHDEPDRPFRENGASEPRATEESRADQAPSDGHPESQQADARLSALRGGAGVRRSDAGYDHGRFMPAVSELVESQAPSVEQARDLQQAWDSPADLDVDGDGIRDFAEDLDGDGVPDDREPLQDSLEETIADAVAINEDMRSVERVGQELGGIALEDGLHGARV